MEVTKALTKQLGEGKEGISAGSQLRGDKRNVFRDTARFCECSNIWPRLAKVIEAIRQIHRFPQKAGKVVRRNNGFATGSIREPFSHGLF